jgi:hypothetical protein
VFIQHDEIEKLNVFVNEQMAKLELFAVNTAYASQPYGSTAHAPAVTFEDPLLVPVPPERTTVLLAHEAAVATAASARPYLACLFRRMGVAIGAWSSARRTAGMLHLGSHNLDKKHQRQARHHHTPRTSDLSAKSMSSPALSVLFHDGCCTARCLLCR